MRDIKNRRLVQRLYALGGVFLFCFALYNAFMGQYGLFAHKIYQGKIETLEQEYNTYKNTRVQLEQRVARLRARDVDADLLEELVYTQLGQIHPDDRILVIE